MKKAMGLLSLVFASYIAAAQVSSTGPALTGKVKNALDPRIMQFALKYVF